MRLQIDHRVTLSLQPGWNQVVMHLLLTPVATPAQSIESWTIEGPGIEDAGRFSDGFGNRVHLVNQVRPESEISFAVRGVVATREANGVLGRLAGDPVPALYKRLTPLTKAPAGLWGKFRASKDGRIDTMHALMARVGETLGLPDTSATQTQMQATGEQSQSQGAVHKALPSSDDYAHLFIGAARALDIPARFVRGYVAPENGIEGGLHSWAEAYDDGLGWIGFDPRHQLCPTERYVRLAVGLDADTVQSLRTVPAGELVQTAALKTL